VEEQEEIIQGIERENGYKIDIRLWNSRISFGDEDGRPDFD
jgi:hypothetical protein